MARRVHYALLVALLLFLALAPVSPGRAQDLQPLVSFEADKYRVGLSEPVTLRWDVRNVDEALLLWPGGKQETLVGPGSKTILFPAPGDYILTLRALYPGGEKQISILFHVLAGAPQPVCTPPACPTGSVLRCPDGEECPGGCGMVCMGPSRIWWVRGNVRDTIVGVGLGGATVVCEAGSVAASTRTEADGTFDLTWQAPADAEPAGKCRVELAGFNATESVLGNVGADGSHQLQFSLKPVVSPGNGDWAINYVAALKAVALGEPLGPVQAVTVCSRRFQNGAMVWHSGDASGAIVALANPTGRFTLLDDTWDQRSTPSCAPPSTPGLYMPDRGLGWAWCADQSVRRGLGYSTEPQEVCDDIEHARLRDFRNGRLIWAPSWNQVIYLLWDAESWFAYNVTP